MHYYIFCGKAPESLQFLRTTVEYSQWQNPGSQPFMFQLHFHYEDLTFNLSLHAFMQPLLKNRCVLICGSVQLQHGPEKRKTCLDFKSGIRTIWTGNIRVTGIQNMFQKGIAGSGPAANFMTWIPHPGKDSAERGMLSPLEHRV